MRQRTAPGRVFGCALLVVALMLALAGPASATTDPGYSWQSGPLVESQDFNCITGDVEQEAGAYMSYYYDPATPPVAGSTYYVAVNVTAIGNTCPGIYGDVELSLPSGTSLAIDSSHPVQCLLLFPGARSYVNDPQNCPTSLGRGTYGFSLDPVATSPPFWPMPLGGTVEINVPIRSAAGVNRIATVVQLADGETDPVLHTYIDTIVNSAAQQPTSANGNTNTEVSVSYGSPSSITSQTTNSDTSVSVNAVGYVWNHSAQGTAYAQLAYPSAPGTTPPANCNSPHNSGLSSYGGYVYQTSNVSLRSPDTEIKGAPNTFTELYPGTSYCWRIVTKVTSGPGAGTYYGNWQFFETQGATLSTGAPFGTTPTTGTSDCSTSGAGCSSSACGVAGGCTTCNASCAAGFSSHLAPPPPLRLSDLRQSHTSWRAGNALAQPSRAETAAAKHKPPPVGTTFSFRLNASASVSFSFNHAVSGRRSGHKCVAKTKANHKKKPCRHTVTAGTLRFTGHSGTNTVRFDGRVSKSKRLKAGGYTLAVAATDKHAARHASLKFTIVK